MSNVRRRDRISRVKGKARVSAKFHRVSDVVSAKGKGVVAGKSSQSTAPCHGWMDGCH